MRRIVVCLITALLATPVAAQQAAPPHAWLFGSWTGGLFPVPAGMTAQACLAQPVVIFTRDVVLRATLVDQEYHQRMIETARSSPTGTEFRFTPRQGAGNSVTSGILGVTAPAPELGFGCEDPNSLHVQRRGENEISFPNCKDFPELLVRCPTR
jgi:hypothetical protein